MYSTRHLYLAAFCWVIMPLWTANAIAEELPTAETVLNRYVEATGGKDAYDKLTNRVTYGIVEIKALNLNGKSVSYEAPPNKNYTTFEVQGIGKMEHGTDGTNSWERNPIEGARIHSGAEKAHHLANAVFNGDVQWKTMYKSYKCVGTEQVKGKTCYKLELETQDGSKHEKYFDKDTGLLTLWKTTVKTSRMDVPTETYFADYRKVDGVLIPHRMTMNQMSQEITITVDKIEHNVKLPAERFDLPPELKKKANDK